MGASGSLLTTAIVFDVCMPARCWIAPEMPTATYSCGETVLPVCPTWFWCGYQPASVAAREAPTAASDRVTETFSSDGVAGAGSGAVEFGRTVMIGVPLATFDFTV